MRSKAWLAAPVLLAHAEVTENIKYFSMGPKLRYPTVVVIGMKTKQNKLGSVVLSRVRVLTAMYDGAAKTNHNIQ